MSHTYSFSLGGGLQLASTTQTRGSAARGGFWKCCGASVVATTHAGVAPVAQLAARARQHTAGCVGANA